MRSITALLVTLLLLWTEVPGVLSEGAEGRSGGLRRQLFEEQDGPPRRRTENIQEDGANQPVQNIPSIAEIHDHYSYKRVQFLQRMYRDYTAAHYAALFNDDNCPEGTQAKTTCTIGRSVFLHGSSNAAVSWEKMVRKMKLNILQYVNSGQIQDFVWATAGNSLAAGHGNFFWQQYTMVMEEKARDLFGAAGLRLVVRPYGRKGDTSAPEVAACVKEIYGTDIDLITWDFAMTDGRSHWRIEFFAHRVHMLPNHPVLLVVQSGSDEGRRELVEHLTDQGMVALRQDEHFLMERQFRLPDSKSLTEEELEKLPPSVRYYRCGYAIEAGALCGQYRFTQNGTCDGRKHQTPWHPGWKKHAMLGHLYALFLMELMDDALYELDTAFTKRGEVLDPMAEYEKLLAEEAADFQEFEQEATLMYHQKFNLHDDVSAMELYRDRTYCHTANVPAETRYKGHVYNAEVDDNWFEYYHGRTIKHWRAVNVTNNLEITYMPPTREEKEEELCQEKLHIDSNDFFLAHGRHGEWQTIVLPNDVEYKHYGDHTPKGIVAVCANACSSECSDRLGSKQLNPDSIIKKQAEFMVNDELVHEVIGFEDCFILVREDGTIHWPNNGSHQYKVSVRINVVGKWMEFNTFILW